jgi:hypothetical protein
MALPKSKQELADWILRRLGAPLVNVEITNEQLEDVIDDALQFYHIWHYDGTQRSYRSIRLTEDMLTGNNRRHQDISAPVYDPNTNYYIGDRVMYKDSIYVKVDSEQKIDRDVFTPNANGGWIALNNSYTNNPGLTDSDNGFIVYDSDLHNEFVYSYNITGPWIDSDGTFVQFDSDKHTKFHYYLNPNGTWVDSDNNGNYVVYDSDVHVSFAYISNPNGEWVLDSDGFSFILYDSDNTYVTQQRFIRYSAAPNRFSRFSADQVRFTRESRLNGVRFDKDSELQDRITYTFDKLWRKEEIVLAEPTIDIDYSQEGQIGIPVPDNIYGITKVFRINSMQSMGMWSYEYQMFLNNFDFFYGSQAGGNLTQYYTTKVNIEFIDFMLNTQPAIRFNKHKNRLYIDTYWKNLNKQKEYYLLAEVYEITDPDVWGDVYHDKWLMRYATSLAKVQWGSNLKKYSGTVLPGGITIDGQALYDEGYEEKEKLEEEIKSITSAMIDSILIG